MKTATDTFACFGGRCAVRVSGEHPEEIRTALERARATLLDAHSTLSRFDPDSELSRLNRDPRRTVPASLLLRRLVAAARAAGLRSGGLVDATLVAEIEAAGYADSRSFEDDLSRLDGGARRPAAPDPRARWCLLDVDDKAGTISRPPGIRIDPGGIAKGLLADLLGERLSGFDAFAVDCCGDLRVGGNAGRAQRVLVDDPAGGPALHELRVADGAIATSGITRRAWAGPDGVPAHQILDPSRGVPAFTGVVQATALAPTGVLAETLAKSALLAGPRAAEEYLPFGGVLVEDGNAVRIVEPLPIAPCRVLAA